AMIDQGVTAALVARDANRNGNDSHTSGTSARRTERVARECTYQDFMKCQPLYFKGTEGVKMAPKRATRSNIALETTNTTPVTNAQLQAMINQGVTAALAARDADRNTNGDDSHISGAGVRRTERTAREFGHDAAYGMPWKTLMKMMTDKYYPRNEIKKLEMEIRDLKVKGTDLTSYTQCF
ncbi:hypothetical protein Tco_0061963, partial [Tanacetum coccineum]